MLTKQPRRRYCTYCSRDKPADGFVKLLTGKGSRTRIKWKCADCNITVQMQTSAKYDSTYKLNVAKEKDSGQ